MTPLPAPKYPPVPLTPPETRPIPKETLPLLRKVVAAILDSDEIYSVTNSPLTCPAGKNHLFTLKPYWWVVNGRAEKRDGQRNPYCDLPKGQAQLEAFTEAFRHLALASKNLPDLADQASRRAEQPVRAFFIDDATRMIPEVLYSQCVPGAETQGGDGSFVIASRYLLSVSQYLKALVLSPDVLAGMTAWLEAQTKWMVTSEQGAQARAYGNNISVWYHALLYTHLSVLSPPEAVDLAQSYLDLLIANHPSPTSFLEKELARTRPRHYVLFTFEPLFIVARVAYVSTPPSHVLAYLDRLIVFAKTVSPGDMEVEIDNDARYLAKLAWFETMLDRLAGREVYRELDGTPWEGGWNMAGRLSWSLL